MNVVRFAWHHLDLKDKLALVSLTFVRSILALMDIAALYLLGFTVSLLASGKPLPGSSISKLYVWLNDLFPFNTYAVLAAAALVLFTAKSGFSLILNLFTNSFLVKVEIKKANRLFRNMTSSNLESLNKWDSHEINYAINSGIGAIYRQTLNGLSSLSVELLLLLTVCLFLVLTNWLAFICMASFFSILGLVMMRALGAKSEKFANVAKKESIASSRLIQEYVLNARVFRAMDARERLTRAFESSRGRLAYANGELELASTLPRYITEIGLMIALALLFLARSLGPQSLTQIQDVTVFVAAGFRIIGSMLPLQGIVNTIRKSAQDARATIDIVSEFVEPESAHTPTFKGDSSLVEFSNLEYMFPGTSRPIRYGSQTIPRQGLVVLVGESGVGKSTLADLLLGMRIPSNGEIRIAGKTIQGAFTDLSQDVAYVPQRIGLFSGTLRDNLTLAFGQPTEVKDEDIVLTLQSVGLGAWFSELAHGLDTEILGSNLTLSGGQLQRLGLVRALIQKPRILILDEVTSALDRATQKLIDEIIIELSNRMCILSITHRPEILANADQIWEMTRSGLEATNQFRSRK